MDGVFGIGVLATYTGVSMVYQSSQARVQNDMAGFVSNQRNGRCWMLDVGGVYLVQGDMLGA